MYQGLKKVPGLHVAPITFLFKGCIMIHDFVAMLPLSLKPETPYLDY